MSTYVGFAKFTDQGLRTVRDTTRRADAVREVAGKYGVRVREILWVQGDTDVLTLFEADDELAASAFTLAVASAGNVRFQTQRAFTREEMEAVLQKL